MAQEIINIGAAPNDGTGDNPRVAFDKSNQNFTELYAAGAEAVLTEGEQVAGHIAQFIGGYYVDGVDPATLGIEGPPGPQGPQGPQGEPGASTSVIKYRFSTTTSPPPASGNLRLNNADPALATLVYCSKTTDAGGDAALVFGITQIDDQLLIQDFDDSSIRQLFRVTALPIDQGTYAEIAVLWIEGAGTFANNNVISTGFMRPGQEGPPGPQGPPGVVSATAPLTYNSGTQNISIDLSAYQPLDADLTALAALTGTNVIYYRSAANTWAAVTIGANLTFSGGTLAATGGGTGNVSNSGTPAAGQYGKWVTATTIQGVAPATVLSDIGAAASTDFPAGAWTPWTPAISSSAGAITSSSVNVARYTKHGKTITAYFDVSIVDQGAGSGGFLQITLPVNGAANGGGAVFGREIAVTSGAIAGVMSVGATMMQLAKYDANSLVVSGYRVLGTAIYESV